jgi:hypothetical protein
VVLGDGDGEELDWGGRVDGVEVVGGLLVMGEEGMGVGWRGARSSSRRWGWLVVGRVWCWSVGFGVAGGVDIVNVVRRGRGVAVP